MKTILPALLLISFIPLPVSALELYLGVGKGLNDQLIQSGNIASTEALELGLAGDSDWQPAVLDRMHSRLRLEIAAAHLRGEHRGRENTLNIGLLRPVLRWQMASNYFADLGLGYAHLSSARFEEIRMAGQHNFTLMAGAGWQTDDGRYALGLRYNHFSNGYTASPNPGLDYATLAFSYHFN